MSGTMHKERRERLQDKNRIIAELNKKITYLNQSIECLRSGIDTPLFFSIIEDKGTHMEQKTIIRQSCIQGGYELLII